MSLRLIGAGLLVLCGGALGLGRLKSLRGRIALLEALDGALAGMEAEIALCCRAIPEIFEAMAAEGAGRIFAPLVEKCAYISAGEAWSDWCGDLELPGEALSALKSLSRVLGAYDGERQAAEIKAVRVRLERVREGLKSELRDKGKSYPALGVCLAGIAAMLMV